MVVVDAVDHPVQAHPELAVERLEVEDRAVQPVLEQRPEDVARHEQHEALHGPHAAQARHEQDGDDGHEDQRRDRRVDTRERIQQPALEHRR
jgi:hypothetical protein